MAKERRIYGGISEEIVDASGNRVIPGQEPEYEEKPKKDKVAEQEVEKEQVQKQEQVAEKEQEQEQVQEQTAEETVEEQAEEVAEEVAEETIEEETAEEVAEETIEEDITEEVEETAEEVEEEQAEEDADDAEIAVAAIDLPNEDGPKFIAKTFAQKMLDADEVIQDRYDELKNYALRFKKLKARISRKFDSINKGRLQFVKLSVAGKTLKLYLNMDINAVDGKFHCADMSDKKTYVTVPVLLRVKSGRAVKYAKILIDQCAEFHGLTENKKFQEVDAMALIEQFVKHGGEDIEAEVASADDDNE